MPVIILFNFSGWLGGATSLGTGYGDGLAGPQLPVTPPPAATLLAVNWPMELPIIGFTICTIRRAQDRPAHPDPGKDSTAVRDCAGHGCPRTAHANPQHRLDPR
ncbi:hypothetical protein ACU4GD_24345 [Cupriavidus basilensis]